MQVEVFIIDSGADVVITPGDLDVTAGDGVDVSIADLVVETPTGETLECVTGLGGPAGKPARADLAWGWSGAPLVPGEALAGYSIAAPTVFTDQASNGFTLTPVAADCTLNLCNRDQATVIGTVSFVAGQAEAVWSLVGGAYHAQRGDYLFLALPLTGNPSPANAGLTLAGDSVQ